MAVMKKKAKGKVAAAVAEKPATSEVPAKKATKKKGAPKDVAKVVAAEAVEAKPAAAAAKQDAKKAATPAADKQKKKGPPKDVKKVVAAEAEEQEVKKAATPAASKQAKDSSESASTKDEKKAKPGRGKQRTMAKRLQEAQDAVEKGGEAAAAEASDEPRGVIYLSHIPNGFFEPQMRKFFSQFGQITRLRLSRSKKNGALKGYGWVEFLEEDVAKIVQQTMEGYLLFGKKLKCEIVPKDKQHPALFKGCKKRMVNRTNARRSQFKQTYNNRPTAEVEGELVPRETVRQHARRGKTGKKLSDKLAALGVTFDLESALEGGGEGDDIDLEEPKKKEGQGTKRKAEVAAKGKAKKQKKEKKT